MGEIQGAVREIGTRKKAKKIWWGLIGTSYVKALWSPDINENWSVTDPTEEQPQTEHSLAAKNLQRRSTQASRKLHLTFRRYYISNCLLQSHPTFPIFLAPGKKHCRNSNRASF